MRNNYKVGMKVICVREYMGYEYTIGKVYTIAIIDTDATYDGNFPYKLYEDSDKEYPYWVDKNCFELVYNKYLHRIDHDS